LLEKEILVALSLLRSEAHKAKDDLEIHATLVDMGIDPRTAARLVEFLPSAYCRAMLANRGVQFSEMFQRRLSNGSFSRKRRLSSEPAWRKVLEYARQEIARGLSRMDLLAVAGRSAEFDATNQLLNKGVQMKDVRLTAMLFPWPEEGPEVAA
jgi:hypothetical protein